MALIVCLCGSTRFQDQFRETEWEFTLQGVIVLGPGVWGHMPGGEISDVMKAELDVLHLAKIDIADFVYVVDVEGYTGESTKREIAYAKMRNKRVYRRSLGPSDMPGHIRVMVHQLSVSPSDVI